MFTQISVAEAAAIINVVVMTVQFTYPLLITLVAVGFLKRTSNAATWSVFGRLIHTSLWPFLLQTDTASGSKVEKRVRIMSVLSIFASVLLAVAAIVTPLGLYSTVIEMEITDAAFSYVRDTSPIGLATQARDTYRANRICGALSIINCPGNDDGHTMENDGTGGGSHFQPHQRGRAFNTTIAPNITHVFSSATNTEKSSLAGIFDIQYRSFVTYNNETRPGENERFDEGRDRTGGTFRSYQQFILNNSTQPIEGLIVSIGGPHSDGIGLRNHTLPPSSEYGYTWTEGILWLEPETMCTDLNITFDYTMPVPGFGAGVPNARLTDRGGIVGLTSEYPYLDLNNTQDHPQLLARSWKAAVLINRIIMGLLNETRENARMNKEYSVNDYMVRHGGRIGNIDPHRIAFSAFGAANIDEDIWDPGLPAPLTDFTNRFTSNFTGSMDYFDADLLTAGHGGVEPIDIMVAGSGGGLLLGVGHMIDGQGTPIAKPEFTADPGSHWSQPIFACLSAVKASVKNITFQLNGTASIENLVVRDVQSMFYASQDDMPIWAIEDVTNSISDVSVLWGLVSENASTSPGISTLQRPEFYLPASAASITSTLYFSRDAVAGADVPLAALSDIFTSVVEADYAASSNWALYMTWSRLAGQSSTAGSIIDYIWTDLVANALVCTKGLLSRPTSASNPDGGFAASIDDPLSVSMPTAAFARVLVYDWRYAVPSILFAALYACLILSSLATFCMNRWSFGTLRFLLNQTAAGRSMTTERYHAGHLADWATTAEWAKIRGEELLLLGKTDATRAEIDHTVAYELVDVNHK